MFSFDIIPHTCFSEGSCHTESVSTAMNEVQCFLVKKLERHWLSVAARPSHSKSESLSDLAACSPGPHLPLCSPCCLSPPLCCCFPLTVSKQVKCLLSDLNLVKTHQQSQSLILSVKIGIPEWNCLYLAMALQSETFTHHFYVSLSLPCLGGSESAPSHLLV